MHNSSFSLDTFERGCKLISSDSDAHHPAPLRHFFTSGTVLLSDLLTHLLTYILTWSRLVYLIRGHNPSRVPWTLAASSGGRSYQESYAHAGPPALSICMLNWPCKTCFPRQMLRRRNSFLSELIYAARWTGSRSGNNVGWAWSRQIQRFTVDRELNVDCLLPIGLLSLTIWACLRLFSPIDILSLWFIQFHVYFPLLIDARLEQLCRWSPETRLRICHLAHILHYWCCGQLAYIIHILTNKRKVCR